MKSYPKYRTYDDVGRSPSVLNQKYPVPLFNDTENYYPVNALVEPLFNTNAQSRKFGAASFCGFLEDTIEVEHCLVIPAIASLRKLPYTIPAQPEQDLFKTATDEGYHAEQSLKFLTDLRAHFGLSAAKEYCAPLFLRRLETQRSSETSSMYRDLISVLNGVVTETRISVELGKFASDQYLADAVREVCRSHADDEIIHASQFRALVEWLWDEFEEPTRFAAAKFITASTIARNLPDIERIALFFHEATEEPLLETRRKILSIYTPDILIDELMVTSKPTVHLLVQLGVEEYFPFNTALNNERARLETEIAQANASV